MIFTPTSIEGVVIVDLEPRGDERGFFSRFFCTDEFEQAGLIAPTTQGNVSYTSVAGTVRGLHWQEGVAGEAKLTRCTHGSAFDVAVDVRPDSPTYLDHVGVVLSSENRRALYLGPGFAHGYQTLEPDTELLYLASAPYTPEAERGIRPDDPRVSIQWMLPMSEVSDKDRSWPLVGAPDPGQGTEDS